MDNACALCPVYLRPIRDRREATVGVACVECLDILDRDLADLATLASELPAMLEPRGGAGGHHGGHSHPGPRLPLSLDALNLMGPGSVAAPNSGALPPLVLLREEATRWALVRGLGHAEDREYVIGPDGRALLPIHGLVPLASWLRARAEWAAGNVSDFPRFARRVGLCLSATRRVAGQAVPGAEPARRIGWCPAPADDGKQCLSELTASTWDDVIRCRECGAEYHRDAGGWAILARSMKRSSATLTRDKGKDR